MRPPDPRIWLPLATAMALCSWREATRPTSAPHTEVGCAIALPLPRNTAAPKQALNYDLDVDASSIRLFIARDGQDQLFRCTRATGCLHLSPDPSECRMELRLELDSLEPMKEMEDDPLWRPLGLEKHNEFVYEATLLSRATSPIRCLTFDRWVGSLRFGERVVRQPMDLWQTALPGRALRMQGHGTAPGEIYGLPRRGLFSFVHDRNAVTLGLDLAWKRRS